MREGWTYKKLGEVLIFDKRFNGISKIEQPEITKFTHVSAEVLKSLQTEKGEVKLLSTGLFSAYTTIDLAKDYINDGEVVTIPTGGVANIKYHKGKFVDSGNILAVSSSPQILLKFVYFGMIANNELINSYFRGASIKHPYMPDIYKITIPIPPLSEQERIVSELDLLSGIIEKKKAQLKEYDQLAQSIFYDMFGDPVTNEKGWEIGELQSVYRVTSSKRILQTEWQNKGVPFYKVADIVSLINGNNVTPTTFIRKSTYDDLHKANLVPNKGDILVTSRGTLGQCYIIKENDNFYFQDGMITWLSQKGKEVSPIYIRAVFSSNSFSQSLLRSANSSTVAYISINQLSKKSIPLPPLFLQQSFAEKIEAIEKQKSLVQQSITETETLFNSRMDYYFN